MSAHPVHRVLLALVGLGPLPDLRALSTADWQALDRLATRHRLQPLLHHQHRERAAIPPAIAKGWAAAYRVQAMAALSQQAELARTVNLLEAAGFGPLALKGAWLSRHAYPHAALRPLRDIDLLLDHETVTGAFEHLLANGYRLTGPPELSLEELLLTDKHLPPLLAPAGTVIELHHRLWEPDGRLDHASPAGIEAAVRNAAIREADGIAYPAPVDMLAHLIVHAVYSHRFDCGPLLLADVDYLLRARRVDWQVFWDRAACEGWRSGARLVLALVNHARPGCAVELTAAAGPAPPAAVIDDAAGLMLQDLERRQSAAVMASIRRSGWRGLSTRLLGRKGQGELAIRRDMSTHGGFAGWAASRLWRTGGDLMRADSRQQSRALARLSRWLDEPA